MKGTINFYEWCKQNNNKLIEEWDYAKNTIKPNEVSYGSNKKVWWLCNKGHSFETTICGRVTRGRGCPYCAGKKVLKGFNDLATTCPQHLKDWDYNKNTFKPTEVTSGSKKVVWWKCKEGHSYQLSVNDKIKRGRGCTYCSGKKVLKGLNDLETKYPELLEKWDYSKNTIKPDEVTYGSAQTVWWKCKEGHIYLAPIYKEINRTKCPYCSGQSVLAGYNDLETLYPNLLDEWDYEKNNIKPSEVTPGSHKIVWWKCKCGHKWKATIKSRALNQNGCPKCNQSKGEKKISAILEKYNVEYIPQYTFENLKYVNKLRFDFAVLKNGKLLMLIEYDGLDHYVMMQRSKAYKEDIIREAYNTRKLLDFTKDKYCKANNINLLRIPFWDFDNIENILVDKVLKKQIA